MRKSILLGLILLIGIAATAQTPTPSPEVKKLDYFAGTWSIEATIPPGPWGGGGKFTSTGTSEWLQGDFFLVRHGDFTMPQDLGGNSKSVAVLGYDPDKKVYTEDEFDGHGRHELRTGTLNGDTWTWTSTFDAGGMTIHSRQVVKAVSPTSFTTKLQVSADGGSTWMDFWDGKGTKK